MWVKVKIRNAKISIFQQFANNGIFFNKKEKGKPQTTFLS